MLTDSTFFFQGFPKCFLGARDNIMVASECLVCGRKCFFVAKYNFIAKMLLAQKFFMICMRLKKNIFCNF